MYTHTHIHTHATRAHTHTHTHKHTHTHTHTHTTYRRTRESFEVTRILSELGIGSIPDILRPFLFLPRVERAWILRGRVQVASSGGEWRWRVKVMTDGGHASSTTTHACTNEPVHSHRDRCSSVHNRCQRSELCGDSNELARELWRDGQRVLHVSHFSLHRPHHDRCASSVHRTAALLVTPHAPVCDT
jgi:hypothetical protein